MRKTIYITLLALLSGCGIYKPYSRPGTELPEQYRDINTDDTTTLAALPWKELFTDEHLQTLIETGLQQNTDLQVARLRVKEADALLLNARLSYLPALSLSPEGGISSYNGTTSKTYNLAASANWELDIFGKTTNAKRGAKAALLGSREYAQAVQTQLIANIAGKYYTLLMLDRQLEIGEETLQSWEKSIKVLEALKASGKANDAAVLQARANRMTLESSVLTLRKNITDTENALSVLLALSPQEIERGRIADVRFPDELKVGVPAQLLSNRPDVRQAEQNLAQAFYATNAARASFYPSVNLSGSIGWSNNGGGVITNPGSWLMSAIGSLVQPLFNRGTNIANLKIAKARQEEAMLLFRQSLLDAGNEVNTALTQWQTARQQIEVCNRKIDTLQEAVRKTELLMRHSSSTYLEVLTAQQALLDAEQQQVQYIFDCVQGVINLYHALGGGA